MKRQAEASLFLINQRARENRILAEFLIYLVRRQVEPLGLLRGGPCFK